MVTEYLHAKTVKEAVTMAREAGAKGKIIAGGTDLWVLMRAGKVSPTRLVSITRIPGLDTLAAGKKSGLTIGTRVTYTALMDAKAVREGYDALIEAAAQVGAVQARNVGTIGGNLCHAAPSADMGPPLLAYGASAVMVGPKGERVVPLEKFFRAPNRTVLAPGDILTQIRVPPVPARAAATYLKFGIRSQLEIAVVGVAVYLALSDGEIADARIALGAVAPTPMRAPRAERALIGHRASPDLFREAAAIAKTDCAPITNIRATAQYRSDMVEVYTRRALEAALAKIH